MKKTLCSIAIVGSLFTTSALAQETGNKGIPSLTRSQGALRGHYPSGAPAPTPPSYCAPCLFYGGDVNPSSPTANAFANENTLLVPDTTTWAAFNIPTGEIWTVDGLFINTVADGYDELDPTKTSWAIAAGLSSGDGGTIVAAGTSTPAGTSFVATGRVLDGLPEYTLKVRIVTTVLISGTYWVNITPQCTDPGNPSCSVAQYFLDDTFGLNRYGPLEPADEGFFNSSFFGFDYAPLCDVSSTGCQALSFGVIGT